MSLSIRWNRLDAPRWVVRLLVLQTVGSGCLTPTAFVAGLLWSAVVLLGKFAGAGGRSALSAAVGPLLSLAGVALLLHPATRTRLEPPAPREPARWRTPTAPPGR